MTSTKYYWKTLKMYLNNKNIPDTPLLRKLNTETKYQTLKKNQKSTFLYSVTCLEEKDLQVLR